MKVIGLTGGIATGKSTVSRMLVEAGLAVLDADLIAREVVQVGEPAYKEIVQAFGSEILARDGSIDRQLLGRLIFAEPSLRQCLNQITHPRIMETIKDRLALFRAQGTPLVILDIPVLFETGMEAMVDEVWVVACDEDIQARRLQNRDGLSPGEVRARLRAQMPLAEKIKSAQRVIDNSLDIDHTRQQVVSLVRSLQA